MNLSNLTREQLEEIVKLQDEGLRRIFAGDADWSKLDRDRAEETRAKVQQMIEEASSES